MDAERFDNLVHALAIEPSRRGLLTGLTAGLLALQAHGERSEAKKKRKKRKKKQAGACEGRVCGPNSLGNGSCGDCGPCKNCEGGACFNKTNGTGCGGECLECQNGACVAKANGLICGGGTCVGGTCCTATERICGTICCPNGSLCIDDVKSRCAPDCDAACIARGPRCGCAQPFDADIDYCNVNPNVVDLCAQPDCDGQDDCAPNGVCSKVSCGANQVFKCLDTCPA